MAASRFSNELAWWENDGYYNFTKYYVQNGYNYATGIYPCDLDQDGDLDLLGTACVSNDVSWWENTTVSTVVSDNLTPGDFKLESIYPNPFNSSVIVRYRIGRPSEVSISIYNICGQKIQSLVNGIFEAGNYENIWDASDYSSGIYFSKIIINGKIHTASMTLLK